MRDENKMSGTEFGILFALGILVVAVGTDLAGRLLHFLYGEWPYICIGMVVIGFIGISAYVHSDFSNIQWRYQQDIDKKLAQYEEKIVNLKSENRNIRDEIAFMRRSSEEHWKLCERINHKAEKIFEQKMPIIIESPLEVEELEQSVHDAVQEVIGGAI